MARDLIVSTHGEVLARSPARSNTQASAAQLGGARYRLCGEVCGPWRPKGEGQGLG